MLLLALALFAPAKGAEAYGFRFEDSAGNTHTLVDYKGKWVLVNFWATWCPPCLKEIPDLAALFRERKDIMIIGVAMDYDDRDVVMQFAQTMTIPYPIVLGSRAIAAQLDDVSMLPSTYFFDPDGKPAARRIGFVTRSEIEAFINAY
jgi:thiol-disulfide isomerase/thioredoxin